jgi:hypothetical protein
MRRVKVDPKERKSMTRLTQIASVIAIGTLMLSPIAIATPVHAAAMTKEQREAHKAKEAECKMKAKEQKLHLVKRHRFLKECMKG